MVSMTHRTNIFYICVIPALKSHAPLPIERVYPEIGTFVEIKNA